MSLRLTLSLSALFLAALAPLSARATVITPLDLNALVDGAEHVALGHVESQVSRWTSDHTTIYTDVTLRVTQVMKGDAQVGGTLTVRREGGIVGSVGMRVAGSARFNDGEEVLVFLERRGPALWTVGMAQGKMRVTSINGQRVAVRTASGMAFTSEPEMVEPIVQPLDAVLTRIAARAAVQK